MFADFVEFTTVQNIAYCINRLQVFVMYVNESRLVICSAVDGEWLRYEFSDANEARKIYDIIKLGIKKT